MQDNEVTKAAFLGLKDIIHSKFIFNYLMVFFNVIIRFLYINNVKDLNITFGFI